MINGCMINCRFPLCRMIKMSGNLISRCSNDVLCRKLGSSFRAFSSYWLRYWLQVMLVPSPLSLHIGDDITIINLHWYITFYYGSRYKILASYPTCNFTVKYHGQACHPSRSLLTLSAKIDFVQAERISGHKHHGSMCIA